MRASLFRENYVGPYNGIDPPSTPQKAYDKPYMYDLATYIVVHPDIFHSGFIVSIILARGDTE